jgi:TatD family hydrolase
VADLAAQHADIAPSFGLHPWYVSERPADWLDRLRALLEAHPRAGVGEIGLDHAEKHLDPADQMRVFLDQLALARDLGRPASIHCRRAWGALQEALARTGPLPAGFVVHSYSGSRELIPALAGCGGYFSYSGSLTYPDNRRGAESAQAVPLDRLLIETDSPDILPYGASRPSAAEGSEGGHVEGANEPANLVLVLQRLADLRATPAEDLAAAMWQNSLRLFRRGGSGEPATRFSRTRKLLGDEAMARLARATVAVAGLGAVGSYAVEGLARAGIGRLRLVDFDVVRESNINRQLYALESTLGQPKVELARQRVLDINPRCEVDVLPLFLDAATAGEALKPPVNLLIDAIDSVGPKVALLAAAARAGVPVISSMGAASRTDPQAIRVGDIAETDKCPLARFVRKKLRKLGVERGIRCVYSVEPPPPRRGAPEEPAEEEVLKRGRRREPLGSLSCLTGIFGLTAANEAILFLAGARGHAPRL